MEVDTMRAGTLDEMLPQLGNARLVGVGVSDK
jgi:hypothetical protein